MIELISRIEQCDVTWNIHEKTLVDNLKVESNVSAALHAFLGRGCDKVLLGSIDGTDNGIETLLGEKVDWENMGTYDLHCLKVKIMNKLEEQLELAHSKCSAANEGFFGNIRERISLFLSFESERKECIKVITEQADELTSQQKAELETTVVSYATFDYKTAKSVVDNLKKAIDLCNKHFSAIKKYASTPADKLNDMDIEYISDMREKLEATTLGNEESGEFFAQLITKRVAGKKYRDLGYTVNNLQELARDVNRNVAGFYRQMSDMMKVNERLGKSEAKQGNYGSSDLWSIYSNICKILRDADRCYKVVEVHLFRTQQKIVRYVNENKRAEEKANRN